MGVIYAHKPPPATIKNYALKLLGALSTSENTWEKGLALARIKRGSEDSMPYPSSSEEKRLFDIISRGKGICSDYTEAYISLCLSIGVPVREWCITPDLLKGKGGHSLVEIYDSMKGEWGIIDPFISAWPALKKSREQPIGLRKYLRTPKSAIVWHPIMTNYFNPDLIEQFYGNRPLAIFIIADQKFFSPIPQNIPTPVFQLFNIVRGKSFHFFVPKTPDNEGFLSGLRSLRISIIVLFLTTSLFLLYLISKVIIHDYRPSKN